MTPHPGDDLRDAITKNPKLRGMVCSGRFDLATPYFATDYQVGHLGLAAELQKNIVAKYYLGGHMMYHVKGELEKLRVSVKRGRPFGEEKWVKQTARKLGGESSLRDPWRPRKKRREVTEK